MSWTLKSMRQSGLLARALRKPLPVRSTSARPAPPARRPRLAQGYASESVSATELQFGQPLHETHPHLLKAGELTTGITALEYATRRARLAEKMPAGSVAVLSAAECKYRSSAVFYDYCQDADFFYLTGFLEPEAVAVIESTGPGDEHIFHLFVRPKDEQAEKWDGARSGLQAAVDVFNADETGNIGDIGTLLRPILRRASEVYTNAGDIYPPRSDLSRAFLGFDGLGRLPKEAPGLFADLRRAPSRIRPLMNSLRVVKSEAELELMRRAGTVSGRAISAAMKQSFPGERELAVELESAFLKGGLDRSAYVPVVAGGENGLLIHYVNNNQRFSDGDMVLIDAGGEIGGYATDISRTWPVTGTFSDAQRDLYSAVLEAQKASVQRCRSELGLSLDELHRECEKALVAGLKQIGFDVDSSDMRVLFPHHIGHFLGLEVHDCAGYPRYEPLRPNQVITIEPGIYVPDDKRWPKAFRKMGIRIEDSVCVGERQAEVLTKDAVKEVADVECRR